MGTSSNSNQEGKITSLLSLWLLEMQVDFHSLKLKPWYFLSKLKLDWLRKWWELTSISCLSLIEQESSSLKGIRDFKASKFKLWISKSKGLECQSWWLPNPKRSICVKKLTINIKTYSEWISPNYYSNAPSLGRIFMKSTASSKLSLKSPD